jgi:class 3 adenylate cyclase
LVAYWTAERGSILEDKRAELSNEFKIKALVEENSLIANRLLSSANNEFWRASVELETQIGLVDATTRFTLASILVVVVAFGAGNFLVWFVLRKRVFKRLDRIGAALQDFADNRTRPQADPTGDEIGAISESLVHYMAVIDEREAELAEKTNALEQLSNQLAKYLSPQVYDSIFRGKQEVKVASSRKKLTIFFSDIAGFTETADRLESEELSQLLNQYLTEMSRIALDHGATIDKYVGDAILVFFGDPETRGVKEDALACVKMAVAMRKRMHDLQDKWRESGIEKPLRVRMGIHTGYCTVGNFGSEDRMDYTIIGGSVNTASRLESLATPGDILISYETFALVRDRIRCDEHGEIEVKGIAYPVATYKVLDSYENLGRARRRFREDRPNVKLDLNLDAMTSEDRGQAADILRRALDMVTSEDEPAATEPITRTNGGPA